MARLNPPGFLYVAGALILLSPLALLRHRAISERPIVTASASDQHVVPPKKGEPYVVATLEFDRPSKDGQLVHCKIADQFVGKPYDPKAFDTQIHLAVRTDSCYDAVRMP
jgi:hypothetical protein